MAHEIVPATFASVQSRLVYLVSRASVARASSPAIFVLENGFSCLGFSREKRNLEEGKKRGA